MPALSALQRRPAAITWVLVSLLFVVGFAFPEGLPRGVLATGLVFGASAALSVTGLVLVYRSSRIINFAQVQIGLVGALCFYLIVRAHLVLKALDGVCDCVGPVEQAPRWAVQTEYWLALVVGLAVAMIVSLLTFLLVVRRFRDAPPLVGTVATIAVSSFLFWVVADYIDDKLKETEIGGYAAPIPPPVELRLTVGSFVLGLPQLATLGVAVVAIGALTLFLRRNRTGVAVRAAAQNSERAAMLGVNSAKVASIVWLQAGLLAGLSGVLAVMAQGGTVLTSGGSGLVRNLAAVVIAGMVDLRLAVAAALGLAVLDQAYLWSYNDPGIVDALIFGIVLVFLLVRRQESGRVDVSGGTWQAAREVRPIPSELRGLPAVTALRRRAFAAVAVLALGYPFLVSPADVATGTTAVIYAMVGLSLLLLTGWAGLVSLGQFAFAAVGGFVVALFAGRYGMSFLVAVPLAAVAGAVASVVVGLPALRIRGLYLAVTTLSFAVATTSVLLSERYLGRFLDATLDRPDVFGLSTEDERVFYYLTLLFLVLVTTAVVGMRRSRTARVLIASRDNDRAAQAFGVDIVRARLQTFAVAGAVAALAGGLFAYQQQGVAVGDFGVETSLTVFLMVVIGGLGSIAGPLLGAAFLCLLQLAYPAFVVPATALAVIGVLLISQGGLTQLVFGVRDAILRRIAVKNRIVVPSLVADGRQAWTGDEKAPLRPKTSSGGAAAYVPVRYRLERKPLEVASVSSTGRGAS